MDFEWQTFPGCTTLGILEDIQKFMIESHTVWNWAVRKRVHLRVNVQRPYVERTRKHTNMWDEFCYGCGLCSQIPARTSVIFWDLDQRRNDTGHSDKPDGKWRQNCWTNDAQLCWKLPPNISCQKRPGKRRLKKQKKGKKSIHFIESEQTIELILRTIISVNQLSIFGTVEDLCKELSKDSEVAEKPAANEDSESKKYLQDFQLLILTPTMSYRETCCEIMNVNSDNFVKTWNCPNCAPTPDWRLLKKDTSSSHLMKKKDQMKWRVYVERRRCLETKRYPEREGGFSETRKIGPVLDVHCIENHGLPVPFETLLLRLSSWDQSTSDYFECVSLTFPTWQMYSVESSDNSALSCNAGSTRLPPECPWIARKYKKCLEESGFMQYWNLFFLRQTSYPIVNWPLRDNIELCFAIFLLYRPIGGSCRSDVIMALSLWIEFYPDSFTNKNRNGRQCPSGHWSWLCLRNKFHCLRKDKQSLIFTAMNPMDNDQSMDEIRCDFAKPRIAPYKKTWNHFQDTIFWCNLKQAQKRRLQFYQTWPHAIVYNTLPATCMQRAVCMKTKEELYHRVCQSPRLPRFLYRSRIRKVDKKFNLIRKQENPQTSKTHWKEVTDKPAAATLTLDYQTESKLITDMGKTEIFELCDAFSKKQCPDWNFYWEIGNHMGDV